MDLLSSLPEDVRCHILSFLTTKEAALTSLLSKKWRNQFALVPNLDFDDSEFLYLEEGKWDRDDDDDDDDDDILESFMGFVDRVLALQGTSPIRKFSLKCQSGGVSQACVNRWLSQVLQRGVSDIDLTIEFKDDYFPPQEMFVSETLVNLRLKTEFGGIRWWAGAEGTFLPMLKSLEIDSWRFFCDDKIELMLPSFPVLEELRLVGVEWIDSDDTVSCATLNKLLLSATGPKACRKPKSVSFDTPNLLSLAYSDCVAEDYPLVNMKSLLKARIILGVDEDQIERIRAPSNSLSDDDVVLRFGNVVKLIKGIQNVQELHLHSDTLEVLSLCCKSMPVFNNIKTLGIKSDDDRGWQAVPALLRNCPNLEILNFEGLVHHVTDKCGEACDCIYRKEKGRSLKSCPVKVIQIKEFRETMKEMHLIEHFLDNFPCLKEMKICSEEYGPSQLRTDPEVCDLILDMIEEYKDLYSCDVQLYEPCDKCTEP
ncbi:PREDICTED: F-box/LRR-repeat protein At3g03030-like [Camelina sativa]|uniref:F-box/LRR-repeat protein At3g03030-like n=1 Tax=Camelina sativa TaxID=90675 RepID=A0ABM0XGF6_CAMSA|nr:PREDICTED: F-box/LRR-repeat protein At3g03030-like [Camelina sativa]